MLSIYANYDIKIKKSTDRQTTKTVKINVVKEKKGKNIGILISQMICRINKRKSRE